MDWGSVTGATGYEREEDADPIFSSQTTRYTGTDTQYDVVGRPPGLWRDSVCGRRMEALPPVGVAQLCPWPLAPTKLLRHTNLNEAV